MKTHKKVLLIAIIFSSVFFESCKDEASPVNPAFTIEQKINSAKPINTITVWNYTASGDKIGFNKGTSSDISDAYATSGYFVVKSYNDFYFNLSRVKSVEISSNSVTLNY